MSLMDQMDQEDEISAEAKSQFKAMTARIATECEEAVAAAVSTSSRPELKALIEEAARYGFKQGVISAMKAEADALKGKLVLQ